MARGDLVVFEEAMAKMLDGDWAASDHFTVRYATIRLHRLRVLRHLLWVISPRWVLPGRM